LISRKDEIVYFRAFGFRDREQKTPMTKHTIFRIASMMKAPLSKYLPEFKDLKVRVEQLDPATGRTAIVMKPPVRSVTVQDLLRHTSGIVYPPPNGNGPVTRRLSRCEGSRPE
jgi:CubicO group peptidase (beta-lactamase class C family)